MQLGAGGGGGHAGVSSRREKEFHTLLMCLVNMMGGSVVVSDVDINNASHYDLYSYRTEDMRIVLTIKEKK